MNVPDQESLQKAYINVWDGADHLWIELEAELRKKGGSFACSSYFMFIDRDTDQMHITQELRRGAHVEMDRISKRGEMSFNARVIPGDGFVQSSQLDEDSPFGLRYETVTAKLYECAGHMGCVAVPAELPLPAATSVAA